RSPAEPCPRWRRNSATPFRQPRRAAWAATAAGRKRRRRRQPARQRPPWPAPPFAFAGPRRHSCLHRAAPAAPNEHADADEAYKERRQPDIREFKRARESIDIVAEITLHAAQLFARAGSLVPVGCNLGDFFRRSRRSARTPGLKLLQPALRIGERL